MRSDYPYPKKLLDLILKLSSSNESDDIFDNSYSLLGRRKQRTLEKTVQNYKKKKRDLKNIVKYT